MSRAETRSVVEKAAQHQVIDTDFHLHVPIEHLYEYVDDGLIRRKLEQGGPPRRTPIKITGGYSTDADSNEEAHGIASTSTEIRTQKEKMGVDTVVVQPGTHVPFQEGPPTPVLNEALLRAYNTYLLEEVVDVDEGIFGTAVVSSWDPELGVAELERIGDHEAIVAAQNWLSPKHPWGHVDRDPIFEAITDLELPLMLHVGGAPTEATDSIRTYAEFVVAGKTHGALVNVLNMIFTGVFDCFPDLDVIIGEGGTQWLPYIANVSDQFYQSNGDDLMLAERMYQADRRYLERMPSDYIFDNMYVTTQPIALPDSGRRAESMLGLCRAEETFMFSTDWPHLTMDLPNWVFENLGIDDRLRERILHETAEEVFRFPK
jgi:predicted TIM-barrel fold metal-dependent hydrolase